MGTDLGWVNRAVPNGRLLRHDLSSLDQPGLLGADERAMIYALAAADDDYLPGREPLLLVHGIGGEPANFQSLVDRLVRADPRRRYQIHVLCYASLERRVNDNGVELADQLRMLERGFLGPGRSLTIVAHSLGGLVTRRALNALCVGPGRGIAAFSRLRALAIDSPWHGFPGPGDRGFDELLMGLAAPFLADGLEDMRAASDFFRGDPDAADGAARAGLLHVPLADTVELRLLFAAEGDQILNYRRGGLRVLPQRLVGLFMDDLPVRGDAQLENFWEALLGSAQYDDFAGPLRDLAERGRLDVAAVEQALATHFPCFPGDHMGVLAEHPGVRNALDWIMEWLDP